ncbi:unnamed protein product [Urochloa humidicola]
MNDPPPTRAAAGGCELPTSTMPTSRHGLLFPHPRPPSVSAASCHFYDPYILVFVLPMGCFIIQIMDH